MENTPAFRSPEIKLQSLTAQGTLQSYDRDLGEISVHLFNSVIHNRRVSEMNASDVLVEPNPVAQKQPLIPGGFRMLESEFQRPLSQAGIPRLIHIGPRSNSAISASEDTLARAQAGDHQAFEQLFDP